MSKITFRADDDLVERLEALETSKSEAMRDALRTYLDGADREVSADAPTTSDTVDDVIRERVDELVTERLDELVGRERPRPARDLNVNVTVDGAQTSETVENDGVEARGVDSAERKTRDELDVDAREGHEKTCDKCGENVGSDHVYCPNCGEKASHRVFCECGDELRSDWAFCPSCGRRTSAADVLERT
ncbi:double zinc ribbon domain-containing protein [Halobellus clavatus]|jgi:RNA polymerase subunit RPABC4/transcription elongation factor Spt4|uniref:DNA polymerase II large subunit n=1 Tax=Halobellus clavatus TaxID=660517 RepID=A0A1H3CWB3_9EURY|nr:zinc ribbon domain-containing protein [Halobellus clavatus]SDX58431.1 DNA polymerase II large subunit [Halobellus clavatus]